MIDGFSLAMGNLIINRAPSWFDLVPDFLWFFHFVHLTNRKNLIFVPKYKTNAYGINRRKAH